MKVKASIKKRGPNDQIVRRKGKLYVINKSWLGASGCGEHEGFRAPSFFFITQGLW